MPSIEITIRDDDGNVIGSRESQSYRLPLGQQTLHEIEGAVESFKQRALPEIEQTLLEAAQQQFTQEKKNDSDRL